MKYDRIESDDMTFGYRLWSVDADNDHYREFKQWPSERQSTTNQQQQQQRSNCWDPSFLQGQLWQVSWKQDLFQNYLQIPPHEMFSEKPTK